MIIYNQGIKYVFLDLECISNEYLQNSNYVLPFEKYLTNVQFYALYTQDEKWHSFISALNGEVLTHIEPIKYTFPKSVFSSIKDLGINILEVLFITSNPNNIHLAHGYHLNTMYFLDRESNVPLERTKLPDCVVGSVSVLDQYLSGQSDGYYNENRACDPNSLNGRMYNADLHHPLNNGITARLYSGGRYFTSGDPRSYLHPLTGKILNFKDGTKVNIGTDLSKIVKINMDYIEKKAKDIDFITSVPAKPGKTDRIKIILENDVMVKYKSKILCDILSVPNDYDQQKKAGGWDNRAQNVNGVFKVNKKISGHVILVDDIITSGSTAMECVKMLLEAGAEKVSILALAVMQTKVDTHSKLLIPCRNCDGEYKLRFNGNDASPFWGCSNYSLSDCRSNLGFFNGCNDLIIREDQHQPHLGWGNVDLF